LNPGFRDLTPAVVWHSLSSGKHDRECTATLA
jgi:hypothetical protein